MSVTRPEPGLRVGGRYVLTDHVADGGMGEVWKADDDVLGREVAVKLLRREYAADESFLARFRGEARHAASLTHAGIAQVYDYGEVDRVAYLVMELVPGEPLSARLARDGALTAAEAIPLLQQTADALEAAHRTGLVHRDVKPGNLLITPQGRVKITDFGIARAGDQVPLTRTGEVMGTAQYLSPEQAMGQTATPASDVYALGIVAFEALSGRRPFDAETPVATALAQVNRPPPPLPDTVPPAVTAVVLAALAKEPADRPPSAAALGQALVDALDGRGPATVVTPGPALGPAGLNPTGPDQAGVPAGETPGTGPNTAPVVRSGQGQAPEPAGPGRRTGWRGMLAGAFLVLVASSVATGAVLLNNKPDPAGTTRPNPSATGDRRPSTAPDGPPTDPQIANPPATPDRPPQPRTPTARPTTGKPTSPSVTPTSATPTDTPTTQTSTTSTSTTTDPTTDPTTSTTATDTPPPSGGKRFRPVGIGRG